MFTPAGSYAGEPGHGPTLFFLCLLIFLVFVALAPSRRIGEEKPHGPAGPLASFALPSLAANASYARIPLTEFWFRSHVVSRIWASLLLAGPTPGLYDPAQHIVPGPAPVMARRLLLLPADSRSIDVER